MKKALGIDWGRNTWGIAIGQSVDFIQPLSAIRAQSGAIKLIDLNGILLEWKPECIILGHPLKKDQTKLDITEQVERCAKWLEKTTNLPVILHDEYKTTKVAKDIQFKKLGFKGLKDKAALDSLSAALILESWYLQQLRLN